MFAGRLASIEINVCKVTVGDSLSKPESSRQHYLMLSVAVSLGKYSVSTPIGCIATVIDIGNNGALVCEKHKRIYLRVQLPEILFSSLIARNLGR